MVDKPRILEFLEQPLLLDRHGSLYVLSEKDVAQRISGYGPGAEEKALNAGTAGTASWVCGNKSLVVSFHQTGDWGQKPLGPMPYIGTLPDYPIAFGLSNANRALIVVNGRDRIYLVEFGERNVMEERVLQAEFLAFTGWAGSGGYCLGGMLPRVYHEGELTKWGTAAVLSVLPKSVEVKLPDADAIIPKISGNTPRQLKHLMKIEACLACAKVRDRVWLVAPVIYDTFDADTDWYFGSTVSNRDYRHTVCLEYGETTEDPGDLSRAVLFLFPGCHGGQFVPTNEDRQSDRRSWNEANRDRGPSKI